MGYRQFSSGDNTFYEAVFNLVYTIHHYYPPSSSKSILSKKDNKDIPYSNLFIWNVGTKQKTKIFSDEDATKERINSILFEIEYDENQQLMVFNQEMRLINNQQISFRHPKNQILIETYQENNQHISIWICDKNGNNLRKITSFPSTSIWHLDIGNNLIRVIKHHPNDIEIEEFKW